MDASALAVAAIGLVGVLGGQLVARMGQRADVEQRRVAEAAAREHERFEELRSLLAEHRVDLQACRSELDAMRAHTQRELTAEREHARRLRSDLAALVLVVRDEVAREAAAAAYDEDGGDVTDRDGAGR